MSSKLYFPCKIYLKCHLSLHANQVLLLQILRNLHNSLLHTNFVTPNVNLRLLRSLIRRTDTSKLLDLTSTGLLVEALGVTLLSNFDGHIDEDFDEWERSVGSIGGGSSVELAGEVAVCSVWGDEGG